MNNTIDRLAYSVIIIQNGETAKLECESYEDAWKIRQSFINYGKCQEVKIVNNLTNKTLLE